MALIAYPECGENIASEARGRPRCGMSIDPRRIKLYYVTDRNCP